MIKSVSRKPKGLAIFIILLAIATFFIGGCAANQMPVISNLSVNSEAEINPGVSCQIKCTASDPDEDELSYIWSANGGDIVGIGSSITWMAPDSPGTYTINVEVSDGREGIATEQLTINVLAPNTPPIIESLTAEWVKLKKASNTPITCIASDPDSDQLIYTWSADAGNFSGEGDTVTWVAPNDYGTYPISVTINDGRGGEDIDSLEITVCGCGDAH
jgi:hypothetical protein